MSASHYFYRYLLNPVMRGLLRSPAHRLTSHNIAICSLHGAQVWARPEYTAELYPRGRRGAAAIQPDYPVVVELPERRSAG